MVFSDVQATSYVLSWTQIPESCALLDQQLSNDSTLKKLDFITWEFYMTKRVSPSDDCFLILSPLEEGNDIT